jgi:hypothetical protein
MQDQKYCRIWRVNFNDIFFHMITIILVTNLQTFTRAPCRRYRVGPILEETIDDSDANVQCPRPLCNIEWYVNNFRHSSFGESMNSLG